MLYGSSRRSRVLSVDKISAAARKSDGLNILAAAAACQVMSLLKIWLGNHPRRKFTIFVAPVVGERAAERARARGGELGHTDAVLGGTL